MPLTISSTRRISLEIGGETITVICRVVSGQELSKFLDSRFETRRNKVKTRVYEARAAFFDKVAIDIENAQYETASGELAPLNAKTEFPEADKAKWSAIMGAPIKTWHDMIAINWKSSIIQRFEDSANAEEDEDGKN